MIIRRANINDAGQISGIYNFYILNSHHTFETEPVNADEMRKRISEIAENYPYMVAENGGEIFGYAYAARYKSRNSYKFSVELRFM